LPIHFKVATDTTVNERVLVIGVPAAPQSDRVTFESLEQEGQPLWRGVVPPRTTLQKSFDDAAAGIEPHSQFVRNPSEAAQFVMFSLTIVN
jgi:hypothetical protein